MQIGNYSIDNIDNKWTAFRYIYVHKLYYLLCMYVYYESKKQNHIKSNKGSPILY